MRFAFDLPGLAPSSHSADESLPTPEHEETNWTPLQRHPIFSSRSSIQHPIYHSPRNLLAWDGASRLYFWEAENNCLHRISLRIGEPEPSSILAAFPSKLLLPDAEIGFDVNRILLNRNGSVALLFGAGRFCVMQLYGRASSQKNGISCRIFSVGSSFYPSESNAVRVLQVLWHPYSSTHLGVLSSDSVFRIFNLSIDLLQPEQEYYLQPARSGSAASRCPVDFSFGLEHLWDKFSVFILFANGSVYVLCPIVPFGSVYKRVSLAELYDDASLHGQKSKSPTGVTNSNFAMSWLESTFPGLEETGPDGHHFVLKAHPFALLNATLCLQGPLRNLQPIDKNLAFEFEGRAVSFLYNFVGKDSILITGWSSGRMSLDTLAAEVQPFWNMGSSPRIRHESHGQALAIAMICESSTVELPDLNNHELLDDSWLGHPPPYLRFAIVDLALPRNNESGSYVGLHIDPLMDQRIYVMHEGGIDSLIMHFLPFTSRNLGGNEQIKAPSVHPVLSTFQTDNLAPSFFGFAVLSDSFGFSWIVGITSSLECVVMEMKTWDMLLPMHVSVDNFAESVDDMSKATDVPDIISKELLCGPNMVLPQSSVRSVTAESIDGRQTLHLYQKLFHETYVEYAHKVYFELQHHGQQLKRITDDQQTRMKTAQEKLSKVEIKHRGLEERIEQAIENHAVLEKRVQCLSALPRIQKKRLSIAEMKFKTELDQLKAVELDILQNSVNTLKSRVKRLTQTTTVDTSMIHRKSISHKPEVQTAHLSQLQSLLEKLSLINDESLKKIKLVDSALKNEENS